MTVDEHNHILEINDIKKLWDEIWASDYHVNEKFAKDYGVACQKFNVLKTDGLNRLFEMYPAQTIEPAWEFPKGKRDISNESNIRCACREFYEETDIDSDKYEILFDYSPVINEFMGNNGVKYKYIYFVGRCYDLTLVPKVNPNNTHQLHEIGGIGWFDWDQVKKKQVENMDDLYHKLCDRYRL
jgi:8-oxo-dGTP pyrophosphatase MutT (NUDIX family)